MVNREALSISGLCYSRGGRKILDEVEFCVDQGEVLVFIGPSGAGKTSLLKCVNLLAQPDAGVFKFNERQYFRRDVDGTTVLSSEPPAIRRRIGMVFQEWNLWPNRTVRENVAEGPKVVLGMTRAAANVVAGDCCKGVGLGDKLDRYPQSLSGGEKQRAAIARALAMAPEILMLDEITSALDPVLVAEVLDVISRLANEGRTIIIVTHHIEFAEAIADRVAFLDGGRIVEVGEASAIFRRPSTVQLQEFLGMLERVR